MCCGEDGGEPGGLRASSCLWELQKSLEVTGVEARGAASRMEACYGVGKSKKGENPKGSSLGAVWGGWERCTAGRA